VTKSVSVPADPGVAGSLHDPLAFVRYLDIIVVVLAAPFVILLGAPVLGYAVGALADREDGLTAGITVLVAFTVYFATSLIIRPLERKSPRV
jgi:hypothetical protein